VLSGANGNHVPGLTTILVETLHDVLELLAIADKNRFSRTTNMNEHSSRSHMMLSATVTSENLLTGSYIQSFFLYMFMCMEFTRDILFLFLL
jgi:hypothetical protein